VTVRVDWWGLAGVGTIIGSPLVAHAARFPLWSKLLVFMVALFVVCAADENRNPAGLGGQFLRAWWNPDFWNIVLNLIFMMG